MIKALCIDDANRPDDIPLSAWVKKGTWYHITHIIFNEINQVQGCELYELEIPKECYPYTNYRLSRFAIDPKDIEAFLELLKLSTELNDVNIDFEKLTDKPAILEKA